MRRIPAIARFLAISLIPAISLILIISLLLALSLFLSGCAKSSSTPTPAFTVSASINGAPTTFNAIISVDSISTPGTIYIVAHSDSANLTPLLEITLTGTPLHTGVYPFTSAGSTDSSGVTSPSTKAGSLLGYTLWSGGTAVQYPAVSDTVTLTAATRNWFSGTFSGTCEYSADSVVSITNGQFAVGYPQH